MHRFELARAATTSQARSLLADKPGSVLKAGGIDLLDHLKERLLEPPRVVDLKTIPDLNGIAVTAGGVRIGPLATLAQVAAHPGLRQALPALAQACGEAASPQIRNVATIGGNLLQRPRCWYYRLESYRCLKKGGDVCYAVGGENRYHAIFGGGPSYATHPSNAAVALLALGASFVLEGPQGTRTVPAAEFFTPPSHDAERENQLAPGELLLEIAVPGAHSRSTYDEVRERAAFDWPLVSVAAALRLEGGTVRDARIVLGAVAPVPWRVPRAEQALTGKPLDDASATAAAGAAAFGAAPLSDNGYKVGLVRTLVRRTLLSLAEPAKA
jgi:xanthine dehydrogenase YagS FAD-binding subunit